MLWYGELYMYPGQSKSYSSHTDWSEKKGSKLRAASSTTAGLCYAKEDGSWLIKPQTAWKDLVGAKSLPSTRRLTHSCASGRAVSEETAARCFGKHGMVTTWGDGARYEAVKLGWASELDPGWGDKAFRGRTSPGLQSVCIYVRPVWFLDVLMRNQVSVWESL